MVARLILIGSCLLLGACSGPWLRENGQAASGLLVELDDDRRPSEPGAPLPADGEDLLQPVDNASYNNALYNTGMGLQLDVATAPTGPMTIDALMQYAIEHHPLLRVRQHDIEEAEGRLAGAGVLPNPEIVGDIDHNVDGLVDMSLRIEATWITGDKRSLRKQVAAAGVARAELALTREAKLVLANAAQAAVDVLYYKQMAQLYDKIGLLANKVAALQKSRVDQGVISGLEGFVVQADAANIEQERLIALRNLKVAQVTLAQAIGAAGSRHVEVEGRLVEEWMPDIPLEAVLEELGYSGPEMALQRAVVEQSRWQEELEHANATPDVGYSPRFSETFSDSSGSWGLRLRRELTIHDVNQGGILASAAARARAEAMLEVVSLETTGSVAAAYEELAPLRAQLENFTTQIEPLLDQTERTVNAAIDGKLIDPNDINAHIRRLVRLRVDHLRAAYRYAQLHMRIVAASPTAIRERRRMSEAN